MPFLNIDIFEDLPQQLRSEVNPYSEILSSSQKSGDLPIRFGSSLKDRAGFWKQDFETQMGKAPKDLILEIGVHKGKVLKQMASDHKDIAFLGMDITMKRVVLSARAMKELALNNAMIMLGNAKFLSKLFAPEELDGVFIFFPDPWTKKLRQQHNRLLNEAFCRDLCTVLKPQGFFWFKTDSREYFENTLEILSQLPLTAADPLPLGKPYESSFEQRFKGQGLPTYECVFRKL